MSEEMRAWHDTWADVDKTDDPTWFIKFLDFTRASLLEQIKVNPIGVYGHLEPAPGKTILDIGCGTGVLLHALAEMVAPDGQVVGIDSSDLMIQEAKKRAVGAKGNLEFEVMDARDLQFADDTFDVVTSTIVFEHVPDVDKAIAEAFRVTAKGGIVSIIDQDLDGTLIDATNVAVTRRIVTHFCDSVQNGWMGRQLFGKLARAGFRDIRVVPASLPMRGDMAKSAMPLLNEAAIRAADAKRISRQEAEDFRAELEGRIADGTAFIYMSVLRATGRKP